MNRVGETTAAPPVEAETLTRDFGSIRAVDSLSFRVDRGEVVGLLGPNGAGKTTTLRMLTGSLIPTRGTVRLAGYDVLRQAEQARARLGYVPEQVPLYGEMRVADYLDFVATMKGLRGGGTRMALGDVRERLALDTVWQRPTRSLSHGYRKRVGLAQALLGDPDLLVLDEPTSGLDPNQIREFRRLLRLLGREIAILLSTHILPEALEVCDRVMILNEGRLVAMDRPERLGSEGSGAGHVIARVRFAGIPDPGDERARLSRVGGGEIWSIEAPWNERESQDAIARLIRQGAVLLELRTGAGSLEEVFRRLTLGREEP